MVLLIFLFLLCCIPTLSYSPGWKDVRSPLRESEGETRRGFLAAATAAALTPTLFLLGPQAAHAGEDLVDFQDAECKFSIGVPAGWEKTVQNLPDRRKIVLFFKPDSDMKTLVFVAYTPVRSDFTSLGSFGSVDEVRLDGYSAHGQRVFSVLTQFLLQCRSLRLPFCQSLPLRERTMSRAKC